MIPIWEQFQKGIISQPFQSNVGPVFRKLANPEIINICGQFMAWQADTDVERRDCLEFLSSMYERAMRFYSAWVMPHPIDLHIAVVEFFDAR